MWFYDYVDKIVSHLPTSILTLDIDKNNIFFDHLPTSSSPSSQWTSLYFKLWNKKRLCQIRIWFTSGEKITRVARGKLCDFVNYTPENWEPKMETIYLECISCWLFWDHPYVMSAYYWTLFDPPIRHVSMNTDYRTEHQKSGYFPNPPKPVLLLTWYRDGTLENRKKKFFATVYMLKLPHSC